MFMYLTHPFTALQPVAAMDVIAKELPNQTMEIVTMLDPFLKWLSSRFANANTAVATRSLSLCGALFETLAEQQVGVLQVFNHSV